MTKDTRELDKLRKAFAAEGQPLADEMARKAAISRAVEAYDEEFADAPQGSPEPGRLMNTGNTVFNSLWRRLMTPISQNMKPLLLGGVSLAVLSVAVLNTQFINDNPDLLTSPEPAQTAMKQAPAVETAKPAEIAEAPSFENKPEKNAGKSQFRLNDADGNRTAQPKRDDAAQLQAVVGDEQGAGRSSSDRKEVDTLTKTENRVVAGNKKPSSEADGQSRTSSSGIVSESLIRQPSQVGGDAAALQSNEPVAAAPAEVGRPEGTSSEGIAGIAGKLEKLERERIGNQGKAKSNDDLALQLHSAVPSTKAPAPVARKLFKDSETFGAFSQSQVGSRLKSEKKKQRLAHKVLPAPNIVSQEESYRRVQQPADIQPKPTYQDEGRDKFEETLPNPVKVTREEPLSTFSIDVDTASYSFMRASLNRHALPQRNAVRVEELINYFPYDYKTPEDRQTPFSTHVSVMPTPWNTNTKLMHIGIKGYELPKGDKPRSNLVFLLDVSGSMNAPNKLPLLRNSFKLLLSSLHPDDTVAIVTYAGRAGTVLEPTRVRNLGKIYHALDRLRSGGSTAGAAGIRQAYQLAERNFDKDGVNRVILATDGDFNVGISDKGQLKSYIEEKRKTGVSLSVLGFGMGNYNDALMQTLAQNGNGNASYIDNLSEAQKVLVEEAGSTLFTIAKDVKIQIEFNPQQVSEYRLIGYETRLLKREDFNNDKIDAGEIGAGHTVTAIYEITPAGSENRLVDDLRYQPKKQAVAEPASQSDEYALLKLRYKLPNSDTSTKIEFAVTPSVEVDGITNAPQETRFATAVAGFGQLLRGGRFTGNYRYDDVIRLALSARGEDEFGYRAEFIKLVRLAKLASGEVRYKN